MASRARRLSLLARFSLLSLGCTVLLGVAVGRLLESQIRDRALKEAERSAALVARAGVQPRFTERDLAGGLTPRRMDELDAALRGDWAREAGLERVKLYDQAGVMVYSDEREALGTRGGEGVEAALDGRVSSEVEHGTEHSGEGAEVLEVYVPLRLGGRDAPAGVFELYTSYAPTAAAIREDTMAMYGLVAAGLALLYAALFRIVARASQALRRQAEAARHRTLHDELTGLPNRAHLHERIAAALEEGGRWAVVLVDLDRFKEINDTLGHDQGDDLLREVARRLGDCVREGDVLARLGGDEFAVLVGGLEHRGTAAELATRLQRALGRPFSLHGIGVELEASIGIALHPEHGDDATTLMQRADVAMYEAKRRRAGITAYDPAFDPYTPARLALVGELRRAIEQGELVLHYQPKVALPSGALAGVEALVRWEHPERGLLSPAEFVPLAERTAAIGPLTVHVLDLAMAQCRAWIDAGAALKVAVNLAAANVLDANLPDVVARALARWRVPPRLIELEISEHTVMADPRHVEEVLVRLRGMGVRLSLDDFGTGATSLAYLRRLPLDELKIDRSLVFGMTDHGDDAVIVRSTIDLARNLGLLIVAEGVETVEVLEELTALSCDMAQGFLLGRPVPAGELAPATAVLSSR